MFYRTTEKMGDTYGYSCTIPGEVTIDLMGDGGISHYAYESLQITRETSGWVEIPRDEFMREYNSRIAYFRNALNAQVAPLPAHNPTPGRV